MKKSMFAVALLLTALATPAFSAEKPKHEHKHAMMKMTPAQREEMAAAHEKMAACLRSDKPMEDCHKEMMQACKEKMGKNGCPMMGEGHGMHGMMHDHGKMEEDEKEEGEGK